MELYNRNLDCAVTTYKYRGCVSVTTFGEDPGHHDPYYHTEDFEDPNPLIARSKALSWYKHTIAGLEREGRYFLPFASPDEFVLGKNAAYTVMVSFVICNGSDEDEYDLLGTDERTMNDTLELEELNHIFD